MKRSKLIFWLVFVVTILLSGCSMRTVDQMYCLPKRPEGYMNLQTAMDKAMADLSYHAPVVGDNRQPVQMKDLDGDGIEECLVFAKGSGENPLKILIFRQVGEAYVLADTLEGNGTAFEQVHYVHFTDREGYDLVVTRQISDQGIRPLVVYSMENGKMSQVSATHYMRFWATDMNADGLDELMILRRGENAAADGCVDMLSCQNGQIEAQSVKMSVPADQIRRIQVNSMSDGSAAVYLTSAVDDTAMVADVLTLLDGQFTNVTLSDESGFSDKTHWNYPIYGEDIDEDGILELPDLLTVAEQSETQHYIVRWYSLNPDGSQNSEYYGFYNFSGGWKLDLTEEMALTVSVTSFVNSFDFTVPGEAEEPVKVMSIFAFTGQEREELAIADNRFVLYRTESTVFSGHLEVASTAFDLTQETLVNAFHLISQDPIS